MFESLFVVLRECAELLLIVVTMRGFLQHRAQGHFMRWLYLSLVAGAAGGALLVVLLVQYSSNGYLAAMLSLVLGLSVLIFAVAMLSSQPAINRHVRDHLADYVDQPMGAVAICAFAAVAAFRESFELGIFLRSAAMDNGFAAALQGALIGVAMVAAGLLLLRAIQAHWVFSLIFRLSTLLLCLLAIQLTLEGANGLLTMLSTAHDPEADHALAWLLTPGQTSYAYLCAALMVWPLSRVLKSWRTESNSFE